VERAEYVRFLVRSVGPVALAGGVLRKARRRLLRRVLPAPLSPLDLPRLDPRLVRGPLEPHEVAAARRLVRHLLPSLARETCLRADRILDGELWLLGEWRRHARGELWPGVAAIDWARDPTGGARAPVLSSSLIDRDAPGLDARALWEAGRLSHVLWLAEAEWLAGLPGTERARGTLQPGLYAHAALLHVRDFMATQPPGLGIHWTCAMEAGLRATHLTLALLLLRGSPFMDERLRSELLATLAAHGRFIEARLEDDQAVPGNHLLADLAGLCVLGFAFPELPRARVWRDDGLRRFGDALVRQTRPGGLSFESSLPYHRFAAELGLLVQAFARRRGRSLAAPALERLRRMYEVLRGAVHADGLLPNLGDNDATHAFLTGPRSPLDSAPVLALADALFDDEPPAAAAETLWLGGVEGLAKSMRRSEGKGAPRTIAGDGLVVLRDRDRSVSLWAGDNGQGGLGGHAHNDKLAAEVCLAGRRVVVDPGSPVYVADPVRRDHFRSTFVHPTLVVAGEEQSPIPEGRPFVLPDRAHASLVTTGPRRAAGTHSAWQKKPSKAIHRREVSLPEGIEAVLVTDVVSMKGPAPVELVWPFTTAAVSVSAATEEERAVLERLPRVDGAETFAADRGLRVAMDDDLSCLVSIAATAAWDGYLEASVWSPGYGQVRPGTTWRVRFEGVGSIHVSTAFVVTRGAASSSREENR
jgi:hypothetical protein